MTKAELRKIYLTKRDLLTSDERSDRSGQIRDLFFENVDLSSVRYLHCFIPIKRFNEVDTRLIFDRLWSDHTQIKTVVPRVNAHTGEIESLRFDPDTALVENAWNIPEPAHQDRIEADQIDVVVVPMLCFDRQGHRVGYGKGFYDKFLSACRNDCLKIGLSYFPPTVRIDDVNELDVTMDLCVTPKLVYRFG
jgi:5-formyltetrahydrofolate cyclo-ligase